jgi:hypothetical protein
MNAEKRRAASRKQQRPVRRPVDDSATWTNTSPGCQDDEIQVIFNNSQGKEKQVSFLIVNRGTCHVRIGASRTREAGISASDQKIPGGAKERVNVTVPAGYFLKLSCVDHDCDGCNWTISDLQS